MKIAFEEYNHIIGLIESAYHEAALKLNLTDSELDILYVLNTHSNGCYQSVLYKESCLTKSTVNSAIRKMEKNGILYLTPATGRNTYVFLTEKGKQLIQNTIHKIVDIENKIYESWSETQQQTFLQLNRDFAEKLHTMVKEL